MSRWVTSSSLVRSNSRPLSLNMATWWGPSLSVTCRQKMSKHSEIHPNWDTYHCGHQAGPIICWFCSTMAIHAVISRPFHDNKQVCKCFFLSFENERFDQPVWSHIPWQESGSSSLLSLWGRSWPGLSSPAHWSSQHSDPQPQPPETEEEEKVGD